MADNPTDNQPTIEDLRRVRNAISSAQDTLEDYAERAQDPRLETSLRRIREDLAAARRGTYPGLEEARNALDATFERWS